jgi:glycosyltransferase involved in cell wall biosynthesis
MINVLSPINQLGYGVTGLNIVKSLDKISDVALWCIGQPQVTNQQDADLVQRLINKGKFLDFNAPCVRIWHQNDMSQFIGHGTRIGFPIFELDTFTDLEKHHLSSLDKIFVCSNWAKNIILKNISFNECDIHVIPLGVDSSIFKPSDVTNGITTRFFNCGKWEVRKGHDILVSLFNEAFEQEDNVELVLMCDNPFCSESEKTQWENLYKYSKLGSKIHIIPRQTTQEEVYNIMKQSDCGVFPSRAEGWNLELIEMMSCGKHVITTDYAAHTEFCTTENSYLVPITDIEPSYDGKWFHGQGSWAKFDTDIKNKFIEHMRTIHLLKSQNKLSINKSGIETSKLYSWENTARKIINAI